MGKYKITAGQNIYDVAMHLYGSTEGIVDLLINNPLLSLDDTLHSGDELDYTDGFTISADVIAYNRMYGLLPANGERDVYPKAPAGNRFMELYLENRWTSVRLPVSGNGTLEIDWGDNTGIEAVPLASRETVLQHYFNDRISSDRKISLYGDIHLRKLDLSHSRASAVYLLRPVGIEKFTYEKAELDISFLSLTENTYELILPGLKTDNLLPLLSLKSLMRLDLTGAPIKPAVVDMYLKALVTRHYGRRNMTVWLSAVPTGIYREPGKDDNGNYLPSSGMEAVWMLTHEATWNEGGTWTFIINENTYTYEPDNQGNL